MILGLGSNGRGVLVANTDYSPATGRFLTEDPVRNGLNWYTYCNNNPIMYIDSSGCTPYAVKSMFNDQIYTFYSSDRLNDGVREWMGFVPLAGIAFDVGDHIIGHHELSVTAGMSNLQILGSDIINNSAFSATLDITTGAFQAIETIGDIKGVDYLKDAKLLGSFGKVLGNIGTAIQVYSVADFYIGNEHIIEQIVSNKFGFEMQSSSINNLEQKYALAYTLVNQLMADGRITYEASFGGTLKSASFTSSDDYFNIIGALKGFDLTIGESSDFIERTYRTYDHIMSRR